MKVLLVIELQKQFKDSFGIYEQCLQYIEENRNQYDKVVAIIFKQNKKHNPNFSKFLDWEECQNASEKDIEFEADSVIIKYGYTCYPELLFTEKDEIFVMGSNASTSILATCFSLWDAGYNFHILPEYIYSLNEISKDETLRLMKQIFGKAVLFNQESSLSLLELINKKMEEMFNSVISRRTEDSDSSK